MKSVIGDYKFKVGDTVKISRNSRHYGRCSEDGTIIREERIESGLSHTLEVRFNGGYTNWYNNNDLELVGDSKIGKQSKTKLIQYKPGTKIGEYVKNLIKKEEDKERLRWLKTFDNCVLPKDVKNTIDEALTVVLRKDLFEKWGLNEHFEKGITNSILIYGPPGTGKTMVSESIAAVLGKNLMVISSASIQSNIPGQSERNMTDSFKKATKEDAVILFDECDSLFYNRDLVGAILSAEINHFLTEIERFTGVVLLTTNRLHKLDGALQRRVIAKVELELPDAKTREKIWKKLIPEKMPVSKLNFKKLAEAPLAGGDIKNVVILAARKGIAKNLKIVSMEEFEVACESVLLAKKTFKSVQPQRASNAEIVNDKNINKILR